jgi:parvulin-like peptidyl-prolyl isomerase
VRILVCLLCLAGCASRERPLTADLGSPWLAPDAPVIRVGPRVFTRAEVYHRILELFGTPEILRGLAEEEQLRLFAEDQGITITAAEVGAAAREEFEAAFDPQERATLLEEFRDEGLTTEEVLRSFEDDARSRLLLQRVVAHFRPLDEASLLRYYRETYAHTRVFVRRLGFPARGAGGKEAAAKLAEEARRRLVAGEPWEQVAEDYLVPQADNEPPRGFGDEWWIREDANYPPSLKKIVFSLEAGEVSPPVWDEEFAYHVFQAVSTIPAEPFAACREKLERDVRLRDPEPEEIRTVLEELQSRFPVEILAPAAGPAVEEGGAPAPGAPGGSGAR